MWNVIIWSIPNTNYLYTNGKITSFFTLRWHEAINSNQITELRNMVNTTYTWKPMTNLYACSLVAGRPGYNWSGLVADVNPHSSHNSFPPRCPPWFPPRCTPWFPPWFPWCLDAEWFWGAADTVAMTASSRTNSIVSFIVSTSGSSVSTSGASVECCRRPPNLYGDHQGHGKPKITYTTLLWYMYKCIVHYCVLCCAVPLGRCPCCRAPAALSHGRSAALPELGRSAAAVPSCVGCTAAVALFGLPDSTWRLAAGHVRARWSRRWMWWSALTLWPAGQ